MIKKALYASEARSKILSGVKQIASAVKVTLGPLGRNVLISKAEVIDYGLKNWPITVTKDGFRTTHEFDVEDSFEKVGVLMVQEAALKSVIQSGDGTSSTVVLLEAIVEGGMKLIEDGCNPVQLKKGIDAAVEKICDKLKEMAIQVGDDYEKIFQIATVSANNDKTIGKLIADAYKKVGKEGIVDIEPSRGINTDIKFSDGYKFEQSFISPLFMTNKEKQVCEFVNPLILFYERRITHHTQIQKALEIANNNQKAVLIICEDCVDEGLAFLAMNTIQGRIKCCVVKSPFGASGREEMEDMATLTGGTFLSDSRGNSIKDIQLQHFGNAQKVIVSKDETIIIGGDGEDAKISKLLNELRANLENCENESEKEPIEKRIAKITGGVAVIQVGGTTETEMKERLDRFDDSRRAVKSTFTEGFTGGGGKAFISSFSVAKNDGITDFDKGMNLVYSVRDIILRQICLNAGLEPQSIIESVEKEPLNVGYNAITEKVENLIDAGIIDPIKVIRCATQNGASAASMILTSECVIRESF